MLLLQQLLLSTDRLEKTSQGDAELRSPQYPRIDEEQQNLNSGCRNEVSEGRMGLTFPGTQGPVIIRGVKNKIRKDLIGKNNKQP